METKIEEKLEQFLGKLKEENVPKKIQELSRKLLEDRDLLEKIKQINQLHPEEKNYKTLKQELFESKDYKEYLATNQELTLWTYYMSDCLKKITKGELK